MRRKLSAWWPSLVVVALVLLVFQALSSFGLLRDFVLPAPSAIARALAESRLEMWPHALETLKISFWGLLLSILIGVFSALLMDRLPGLYRAFYPLIVASQTIPTIVITPVVVLLFGYGAWPRLVVVVLVCFFPLVISLLQGLFAVDSDLIRLMETMGASQGQTGRHVKWPAARPAFFSGLRISATYCVMAAVLAEWSGSGLGLGLYMMRMRRAYRYDRMFAAVVWIAVLSLLFFTVSVLLERLALPWQRAERRRVHVDRIWS